MTTLLAAAEGGREESWSPDPLGITCSQRTDCGTSERVIISVRIRSHALSGLIGRLKNAEVTRLNQGENAGRGGAFNAVDLAGTLPH